LKFTIKHEIKGRLRVHMNQKRMSCKEADTLLYYLYQLPNVTEAKVYERTGNAAICYSGRRQEVLDGLAHFQYDALEVPEGVIETSGRELNAEYQEKLIMRVLMRMGSKLFIPYSVRAVLACIKSVKYIRMGVDSSSGGIWIRRLPLCSCSVSENFWRSGLTKSPLGTWPGVCL